MFFGREDLLGQLSSLWNKRVSSLVTCRGRRRIGKSTICRPLKGSIPIEPVKDVIDDDSFAFVSLDQFEGWNVDMGLAFENLIVNNYRELLPHLHLDRVLITSASPYCRQPAERSGGEGVQVDLLLQTRKSICIVEIKRRQHIGREVVAEMDEKCRRIARPKGVSLKTALVYDGELAPSVEADGYFDAIVPASSLLGL